MTLELIYNGARKIWRGDASERDQVSANQGDEFIAVDAGLIYRCTGLSGAWVPVDNPHGYLLEVMTDPDAPVVPGGHLYIRDRGDGTHQLMCRFPSGAIQVVCTEP